MATLTWDALGERKYEIGVDHGVFYRYEGGIYTGGVAWNGLTGVDDNTGGRDASPLYSGGVKVGSEYTSEEYSGSIRCYTFPDEFEEYLGEQEIAPGIYARQQDRDQFGFCYRSKKGNDTEGTEHGYKLHLIYNMKVTDFSRSYSTVNESMDIQETEISFETFPQPVDDEEFDPMSEIVLDSTLLNPDVLEELEEILYGTEDGEPRLPFPDEIIELTTPKEEMPDAWKLFPNTLVYPAADLHPYDSRVKTYKHEFTIRAQTLTPIIGGTSAFSLNVPLVPVDATIISYTYSGTPEQYEESLSFNARLSEDRETLWFYYNNITDGNIVIAEPFTVTVSINYFEKEGE